MGVDANATADGTRIYQFTCAAVAGQIFRFESLGGATYRIINQSSGKCLSASGTGNAATLHINACNGGATQAYTLQPAGANYNIINSGGGNCVEVALQSTSDGAAYLYRVCNGDSNQVFRFDTP
jgi:galactose oxidase